MLKVNIRKSNTPLEENLIASKTVKSIQELDFFLLENEVLGDYKEYSSHFHWDEVNFFVDLED